MTTLAWGMTIVGFSGLFALCFRTPESDATGMRLLFGFLVVALSGVMLLIYDAAPYKPVARQAVGITPIAGAPLFVAFPRVDQAHAAVGAVPLRRLPIADSDLVLP
jgi:hypothetical protein